MPLVALVVSGAVTLLFLEAALHVIGYPRTKAGHSSFIEYDPQRGWHNRPNAKGLFSTDEYQVSLEYNSRGIRGPERPFEKPPGTYRIVMLGDSYIEGYSVPREQRVAEVLEEILSARDPSRRYEVIALGTAGYSTDQELLWLESEGLRYQPDMVVVMFYMNDVYFNGLSAYWRGEKPVFVLSNGELTLTNVPVPDTRPAKAAGKQRSSGGVRRWLRSHSKLYQLAVQALENSPGLRATAARFGLASPPTEGDDGGPRVAEELNVFRQEESPAVKTGWALTEALLGRMARSAAAAGAEFIAFHIPFKGTVYPESWQPILTQLGIADVGMDPELVRKRFVAACRAQGLTCVEPTEEFRRAATENAARGERIYWVRDNHWNAGGHRLAAEILAERIGVSRAHPTAP
jgi:lysophospholipase L1-like esterase